MNFYEGVCERKRTCLKSILILLLCGLIGWGFLSYPGIFFIIVAVVAISVFIIINFSQGIGQRNQKYLKLLLLTLWGLLKLGLLSNPGIFSFVVVVAVSAFIINNLIQGVSKENQTCMKFLFLLCGLVELGSLSYPGMLSILAVVAVNTTSAFIINSMIRKKYYILYYDLSQDPIMTEIIVID